MKTSKVHITYLVSTLGRSGPTRQLLYLIERLDLDRFKVTLVTLSPEPSDTLRSEFLRLGIDCKCLTKRKTNNPFLVYKRLTSLFRDIRPDVLHSQGLRADLYGFLFGRNRLQISSQRNDPYEDYPALYGPILGKAIAAIHIWTLRKITRVITCSQSLTQKNIAYRIKSDFIRNGIDRSFGNTLGVTPIPLNAETFFRLFQGQHVFLYSGPLVSRKQPQVLIQAFLEPELQKNALVILGEGPLTATCLRIANDAPNIFFAGSVDNVSQYLLRSTCYISASLSEGLPNSVLEAFRAGLPAILSDIPAHREFQELVPDAVRLFPANNAETLGKSIAVFTRSNKNAEVTSSAIRDYFNSEKMSGSYQNIYIELTFPKNNSKKAVNDQG